MVFLNVVDSGTLSGAARKLGVSAAAVSATLARLEKKLAVRLLDHTTRRPAMTPEGTEFYARCKQIVSDLDDAERGRQPDRQRTRRFAACRHAASSRTDVDHSAAAAFSAPISGDLSGSGVPVSVTSCSFGLGGGAVWAVLEITVSFALATLERMAEGQTVCCFA